MEAVGRESVLENTKSSAHFMRSPPIPSWMTPYPRAPYPTYPLYLSSTSSPSFLPFFLPFLLSMALLVLITVFLLHISGAHSFQGGRLRLTPFPLIFDLVFFFRCRVYPSLLSIYCSSLILLTIGRLYSRTSTRLSAWRSPEGLSRAEVTNDTPQYTVSILLHNVYCSVSR